MIVWFVTIALLGLPQIIGEPGRAARPSTRCSGCRFSAHQGLAAFLTLGSVFLSVTGAEALYADMGHFGRRPIRIAWFSLVLPSLVINYLGQGALLLADPNAREHPFFHLAPRLGALPDGRSLDHRHGHRLAGGHLWRILAHAAGDSARLLAAFRHPPHLGPREGAGLHSGNQLDADGWPPSASCSGSGPRPTWPPPTAWRSQPRW